ncbi:hypothetical protein [Agriterribacter sp.]|uniref:hypothetical protein n=1 Tax=Agriterribacter sp. TaxID=2821509 RepID=UPI002C5DDB1F|nr:hypothetical protein [Agriterribacter sp.]HRO45328.1 hypothetical protein [Agriterribacter sp.]HRQ17111.1 hypothetical protein [Agriterribacter sp.]
MDNVLITLLQKELSADLHDPLNEKELQLRVQEKVSELIEHDFQGLINILYRIDVSEVKLKQLLKTGEGKDAALIIGNLIIERQAEKLKHLHHFKDLNKGDDKEEKW